MLQELISCRYVCMVWKFIDTKNIVQAADVGHAGKPTASS